MTRKFELGARVINSIGRTGTVVEPTRDPFGFIYKSGKVPVHLDGEPEDENFLHDPDTLELEVEDRDA